MRGRKFHPAWYLLISLGVIVLDQLLKGLTMVHIKDQGAIVLIPGLLRWNFTFNDGVIFGMDVPLALLIPVILLLISGMILYLVRHCEESRVLYWALACFIGGGLGNLIDRFIPSRGMVVDMIDFYGIWPYIFNIADIFVCVGSGLLILYTVLLFREESERARTEAAKASAEPNDAEASQAENVPPAEDEHEA